MEQLGRRSSVYAQMHQLPANKVMTTDSMSVLNPDQSRSVTNLPPGARHLEFTAEGRPLLREYRGGDLQSVLETLEALMVLAWRKSLRKSVQIQC